MYLHLIQTEDVKIRKTIKGKLAELFETESRQLNKRKIRPPLNQSLANIFTKI